MADDAGALLVRSGLVSAEALDGARARVTEHGGTLGEQLVASGVISDESLTDFYKARLLVPQVNPNTLARLPAKVVAVIPSDMAIELRAIPVSLDRDNNLTVAMSDPSDRHAVDEIGFFTGAYVVRAVATQMQIAWCLAHYYGHLTHLGQRLLQPEAKDSAPARAIHAAVRGVPRGAPDRGAQRDTPRDPTPAVHAETAPGAAAAADGVPEAKPAERSPGRRAPSIKPPLPEFEDESSPVRVPGEPSGPVIAIEAGEPSGPTGVVAAELGAEPTQLSGPIISIEVDESEDRAPDRSEEPTARTRPAPRRVRPAEPDPPELYARAGEVDMKTGPIRVVPIEEPRVVIAEELEAPILAEARAKTAELDGFVVPNDLPDVAGEVVVRETDEMPAVPMISVEVSDEPSAAVVIHEHVGERSEPVLLERRRDRDSDAPTTLVAVEPEVPAAAAAAPADEDEAEAEEIVELPPKRAGAGRPRGERRTQLGIGVIAARTAPADDEPTRLDARAAPPADYTTSEELLAAPPSPLGDEDTSPVVIPPRPGATPVPPPSGKVKLDNVRARSSSDDDDEDGLSGGPTTMVMTAVDLDEVLADRKDGAPRVDYDPVDDGWGPPGTTIPPPLLGAIPGAIEPQSGVIPIPNIDSAPLMMAPPVAPEVSRPELSPQAVARAFEDATTRMLELLRELERAADRDDVIARMIEHLALTHRRAGFFAVRAGELSLFALRPRPATLPFATLRLDRPSTLQDVVGTRLPYRGPMHDDASRLFLTTALGASPAEILLVPVTVRERVVGVLFGEQRTSPTFDDQLALAARAAGVALERILKARRG